MCLTAWNEPIGRSNCCRSSEYAVACSTRDVRHAHLVRRGEHRAREAPLAARRRRRRRAPRRAARRRGARGSAGRGASRARPPRRARRARAVRRPVGMPASSTTSASIASRCSTTTGRGRGGRSMPPTDAVDEAVARGRPTPAARARARAPAPRTRSRRRPSRSRRRGARTRRSRRARPRRCGRSPRGHAPCRSGPAQRLRMPSRSASWSSVRSKFTTAAPTGQARSLGRPRKRSPMMLRWICDVPAAIGSDSVRSRSSTNCVVHVERRRGRAPASTAHRVGRAPRCTRA